jgi:hypothetical protein
MNLCSTLWTKAGKQDIHGLDLIVLRDLHSRHFTMGQTEGVFALIAFEMQMIVVMMTRLTISLTEVVFDLGIMVNDLMDESLFHERVKRSVQGDSIVGLPSQIGNVSMRKCMRVLHK